MAGNEVVDVLDEVDQHVDAGEGQQRQQEKRQKARSR